MASTVALLGLLRKLRENSRKTSEIYHSNVSSRATPPVLFEFCSIFSLTQQRSLTSFSLTQKIGFIHPTGLESLLTNLKLRKCYSAKQPTYFPARCFRPILGRRVGLPIKERKRLFLVAKSTTLIRSTASQIRIRNEGGEEKKNGRWKKNHLKKQSTTNSRLKKKMPF